MSEPTLSALVSTLTPEAAEQWRALVEADERIRSVRRGSARLAELSARDHSPPIDNDDGVDDDWAPECDLCAGPCAWYETKAERRARVGNEPDHVPLTDEERTELAALRAAKASVGTAIADAEKAKRAPARWLEERGLLDGLWKALWRERHQRGET